MADHGSVKVLEAHEWAPAQKFEDFALVCCGRPHLELLTDPDTFSLTQRVARVGSVTVDEMVVGADFALDRGEVCNAYRVVLLQAGRIQSPRGRQSVEAGVGTAVIYAPDGLREVRWTAGTRVISLKIDRSALDDTLADALGRQVRSPIDFTPVLPMSAAPAVSWVNMLLHFKEELFRPNSLLYQPLVTSPFTDSLLRGLLVAADHSHRHALTADARPAAPRTVRLAVEMIEAEAHLPLTASSIAARCHISVRSLQESFRRHMGMSPMTYLRQVRLRRAHDDLLEADPSTTCVAAVAYHWGFTNLGRFAAAHAARYDESPAVTLKRT